MFLFPGSPQDDPLSRLIQPDGKPAWAQHNISILHREAGESHLRSLNVPFCINVMAGGRYRTGQQITFTSISGAEHFHLEKSSAHDEEARESTELHQHDYFELMYVMEGEVEQHIESGCFVYPKGTACLMNRNTRHFEVLGESYFLVFLCLSKDFIRDSITADFGPRGEGDQVARFFTSNLEDAAQYQKDYLEFTPVSGVRKGPAQLAAMMEELTKELLLKQAGHTYMVVGLVSRVLALLQSPDLYTCAHITLDSSTEAYLFNKVTRFMECREGRVTRAELAEHLSYSSDYINRIVKKHSGMSISEYNQVICLKKAERLLTESDLSINSIITALGFENKTYFYKLFDRRHGATPLQYRKRHGKSEKEKSVPVEG